jgi:hypothetical protein
MADDDAEARARARAKAEYAKFNAECTAERLAAEMQALAEPKAQGTRCRGSVRRRPAEHCHLGRRLLHAQRCLSRTAPATGYPTTEEPNSLRVHGRVSQLFSCKRGRSRPRSFPNLRKRRCPIERAELVQPRIDRFPVVAGTRPTSLIGWAGQAALKKEVESPQYSAASTSLRRRGSMRVRRCFRSVFIMARPAIDPRTCASLPVARGETCARASRATRSDGFLGSGESRPLTLLSQRGVALAMKNESFSDLRTPARQVWLRP